MVGEDGTQAVLLRLRQVYERQARRADFEAELVQRRLHRHRVRLPEQGVDQGQQLEVNLRGFRRAAVCEQVNHLLRAASDQVRRDADYAVAAEAHHRVGVAVVTAVDEE